MNLKRIGVTVMAIVFMVGSGITNIGHASELEAYKRTSVEGQIITPYWTNISDVFPYISATGTTLYPEVYIEAKSSSSPITGTMYLEKYSSGRWTNVTSWNIKGTGSVTLSKSYIGTSGVTYRTRVVVTVNGETVNIASEGCEI